MIPNFVISILSAGSSFPDRLYDHILRELLAIQEGPQILQRFGDKGSIGPLNRSYARSPDLIGNNVYIANHRPTAAQILADSSPQIRVPFPLAVDHCRLQPISASDLAIIGNRHARLRTASDVRPAEIVGLTGSNRSISLIVKHETLDRQSQVRDGSQFLDVELKSAIAVNTNRFSTTAANTHADASGDPVSHRPQSGGMKYATSFASAISQQKNFNSASRVPGDDAVVRSRFLPDNLGEMVNADESRSAMRRQNQRITSFPVKAPLEPRTAILIVVQRRASLPQHDVNKSPCIGTDRIIDSTLKLAQLSRIDIDHSFVSAASKLMRIPTHKRRVKTSSNHQHEIGILQSEISATRSHRARTSDKKRIVIVQQIHGQPSQADWNIQNPHKLFKRGRRAGNAHSISRKNKWPLGPVQPVDQVAHFGS